jgi:Mrp family chromosome partitioning ATPase
LNAKAVQLLFAQLRRHFDYIIVDCPPLPAISDAMTLGLVADLILSVVKLSYTKRRVLMVHNELLSTLNVARGLVVNAVENQGYERSSKY